MSKRRRPVSFRLTASGRFSATPVPVERLWFQAPSENTNVVYVSDSSASAVSGAARGIEMQPGAPYSENDTDLSWWWGSVTGTDVITGHYFEDTEA